MKYPLPIQLDWWECCKTCLICGGIIFMLIHNPVTHKFRILVKIYEETCVRLSGSSANLSRHENPSNLDF